MLKKLTTAVVLFGLTFLMVRETADFYLMNGSYFWFAILTVGLYLIPFGIPFFQVALPFTAIKYRKWIVILLLIVNVLHGIAILQYNLPYTYTDEGGVGKAVVNQALRWIGVASSGILTLVDAIYLGHDWRPNLRATVALDSTVDKADHPDKSFLKKVNNFFGNRPVKQVKRNPKAVKRYLIGINCGLPFLLLIAGELIIYLTFNGAGHSLQILWPLINGLFNLLLQSIAYLLFLPQLRGLKISRQLAIIFSTTLLLFTLGWSLWLLAVKFSVATGFWGASLMLLMIVMPPYIVLPLVSGRAAKGMLPK
ncbi:hypothetical protein [Loigolactobacillus backii]|uniref:Uncharacterized protein n=1 Tax=Loigolactobacillus backii TaxID=375175 RepID=A0A192GY21_9LACO|nr:hypothetical protein [Loigolactobacillus backii]ANK58914.1 hypothetical protein AYR52_00715 [Loigolactobacillus backii]ANK61414.1 hypothetical protein AYR53_00760 [Loigolactobacillus backii]ANK63903.1 hypothetical protein AYR54_00705 [Loigolactobacillus backii]ANK66351.1 hypothetical protein AYR55_00710 [Loigolactobacillus backii]ANK69386.1 hypothetical protein AYR56_03955 [Loigolactobacillus backii]